MKNPGLYTSNKVENLVQVLAEVLSRPLSTPLQPEVIVVQSKGMERYLSMQLADRLGIWANCRYLFPNGLLADLFGKTLGDIPSGSPFEPEVLTWRIMRCLPPMVDQPGFRPLREYLAADAGDLRRLQLAALLADTFDQYLLFRPDIISRWEKGDGGDWQAMLWRELSAGVEGCHRVALAHRFVAALDRLAAGRSGLPERISLFGISALPRFHMELLAAVSRFTEVNLFLMNPCREYWGDLPSGSGGLLGSLGKLGRDFMDMVIELGWEEFPLFESPVEDRLLHVIQADILDLRETGGKGKRPIAEGDGSVQIHACHSPMREVEVLRDRILGMMDEDPGLRPCDILVMTPDIRVHAPYIQAVFDIPPSEPTFVPFSIADQGAHALSTILLPFNAVLDLPESRFGATQVLEILESPPVCRRFGIEEAELELIRRWVGETRIRWGRDGRDRGDAGIPRFDENTWRAGLDRLLLGYAMHGGGERLFGSILPYDAVEGAQAASLGRLASFVEALSRSADDLRGRRSLAEWARLLSDLLGRFFAPDADSEGEVQRLRAALTMLARMGSDEGAGYGEPLDLRSFRWQLGRTLERQGFGYGFLTGGVTFCAMLPMRSVPAKVICLVGMNNSAYPRESPRPGFDLIGLHPRAGDRSRRTDDRYLFLEALLAARGTLYISYVGKDIQDDSTIPPSVLVSELMDEVEQGFTAPSGTIADHLLTTHALQPFSPRYFRDEGGLFSYSEEDCEAARRWGGPRSGPTPFFCDGLPPPGEEEKTVSVDDLCSFFVHPTRYLLQRRLALHLDEEMPAPEDKEPMGLGGLERYRLEQEMVRRGLEGKGPRDLLPVFRASGSIPPGHVGTAIFEEMAVGVEKFVRAARPLVQEGPLEPLEVDRSIGPFRLTGRIDGLYPGGMVRHRYGRVRPADLIRAWIRHLVLCGFSPEGCPGPTTILSAGEKSEGECVRRALSPVDKAEPQVRALLDLYWSGLVRPLPFFPSSSWSYAETVEHFGKTEAIRNARKAWQGSEWERGECDDPYHRTCFEGVDPLDASFEKISLGVLGPLLKHLG